MSLVLGQQTYEGLQAVSRAHEASLFMTLLASTAALLNRYTRQEDLIIGSPVAARDHEDLADQLGFYANYLPLRIRMGQGDSFAQLLDGVKKTALAAYEHQVYPFDRLVSDLQLDRDMSRAPLFDVAVLLLEDGQADALDGLSVEGYDLDFKVCPVDLRIAFSVSGGELHLHLDYNLSLFSEARMVRMLGHYERLTQAILRDHGAAIGTLDYLSPSEKDQLLSWGGAGQVHDLPAGTVIGLFEEQVQQAPGNVAIWYEGQTFTYAEINEQANKLAYTLRHAQHVGPDDRVGLLADRSPWMLIGMLGILKAGGAYLPIDPAYPARRTEYMLRDANVTVLLTESRYLFSVSTYPVEVVALDLQLVGMEDHTANLPAVNTPSDLAYVIYTSGSTGEPKGVMIEHHSLVGLCHWHREAFRVDAASRATLYAGIGFDASGWEIWPYLLAGAALYPVAEGTRVEPGDLIDYLHEANITHSFLPTVVYEQLSEPGRRALPESLVLLTGGDKLRRIAGGNQEVVNNYGPTEATVVATSCRLSGLSSHGKIPIGKPIANTRLYILDENMQLQPEGVPGELYIGGGSLARGYLHQPALTRSSFLPDPFRTGERLYKTGDVGRWLADGNAEFVGRKDNQVKLRGHRIELGEIEGRLLAHGRIKGAKVLDREDAQGEKYLVAYYIGDEASGVPDLRAYLEQVLPQYMVPA
ncbi:MAG: amino acid adenylation domain-containing protein, partial [Cytophagales bacterium]|nr:amino acid adenylation domain-containing protein [Cytophagales bacterium]